MYCLRIYAVSRGFIVIALSATCISAALTGGASPNASDDCQIGAYRFPDGGIVDIARSEDNAFRWRKFDGSTGVLRKEQDGSWTSTLGWTDRADGHTASFTGRANGEIEFDGKKAHRVPFDVTDIAFEGRDGTKLAGRLVLPKGDGRIPVVVLVHGAERES